MNEIVSEALNYIDAHVTEVLSSQIIADNLFVDKSLLCRRFKCDTGTTISHYIKNKRLAISEELLVKTNLTIDEIAKRSGFSTTASFIKDFTKTHVLAPREYRKSLTKNNRLFYLSEKE